MPKNNINKRRFEIFTDALIAIIMTILVLDLKVQPLEGATESDLLKQLLRQLPHFFGFVISFALIAALWLDLHDLMEAIEKPTRVFAVINLFFIGAIATLPFSTAFAAEYPNMPLAVSVLAINMFIMNLFLGMMFLYSQKKNPVQSLRRSPREARIKKFMGITGTFVFLGAAFIAYVSMTAAFILIAFVPIMHLIPIPKKFAE